MKNENMIKSSGEPSFFQKKNISTKNAKMSLRYNIENI
jgi:hypothetical protein